MKFCNEHGIPHSVFLETWSAEDRAKALAQEIESAIKCGLCGTAEWEWERDPKAYAPHTRFCWGCYYREVANENERQPGQSVVLVRNTDEYKRQQRQLEEKLAKLEQRDGVDSESAGRSGHQH